MPTYPNKKNLIKDETNNLLEKLTEEHSVGPTYSCLQIGAYCLAQVAAVYEFNGKKVPKELQKFLEKTYPQLMEQNQQLMEEQHLMLNSDGSA